MTANRTNKLAMLIALSRVFNLFEEGLSSIPAQKNNIKVFSELLQKIKREQHSPLCYKSPSSKLKAEAIQSTVQIAAAIYVYAHTTRQPALKAVVKVSANSLHYMSYTDLHASCTKIYKIANAIFRPLRDYGVTRASISQLKQQLDDLEACPLRSEPLSTPQATDELSSLFDRTDHLLRYKIDKLMLMLELAEPIAYNAYLAARIIVDLKGVKIPKAEALEA